MRVRPQRDTECAGQAKVGKLEVALLVNQEVLRLEVTVEDTVDVTVEQALDELVRELLRWVSVYMLFCLCIQPTLVEAITTALTLVGWAKGACTSSAPVVEVAAVAANPVRALTRIHDGHLDHDHNPDHGHDHHHPLPSLGNIP